VAIPTEADAIFLFQFRAIPRDRQLVMNLKIISITTSRASLGCVGWLVEKIPIHGNSNWFTYRFQSFGDL
jgi:hypothetical protein